MHIFAQLTSKLAFCHNQPRVECVPGACSPDINLESWQSMKVTRLRMTEAIYLHSPIYASKACTGTTSALGTVILCH